MFTTPTHRRNPVLPLLLAASLLFGLPARSIAAPTLNQLQSQADQLKQQAALDAQKAAQKGTLAEQAAQKIEDISSQIDGIRSSAEQTITEIQTTQDQIAAQDQEISQLKSQLGAQQDQQDELLRQLYVIAKSDPAILRVFSDQPASEAAKRAVQFDTLLKAVKSAAQQTQEAKAKVEQSRSDLQQHNDALATLNAQQKQQQQTLADIQGQQQALRDDATTEMQILNQQSAAEQAQAAQVEQKIKALTYTSNWGSQIVSSDDPSWYYTQTGDNTRLGNSWYTVGEVGCLITSIAMVNTYYGQNVTPDYIATHAYFTSDGYLIGLPALKANLAPSVPVNWNVVNRELANNRPVIVSIYLPSVGVLNYDGSSHFIVIKDLVDGKYLMHDPVGPGRGYSLNQVRSMITTSD